MIDVAGKIDKSINYLKTGDKLIVIRDLIIGYDRTHLPLDPEAKKYNNMNKAFDDNIAVHLMATLDNDKLVQDKIEEVVNDILRKNS